MQRNELKKQENKKELNKIFKYLTKNLKIKKDYIEMGKKITRNDQDFFPNLICYLNKETKSDNSILMMVSYINLIAIDDLALVAKNYLSNFESLYFVLVFDKNLNPYLFYKKENLQNFEILMIESKFIKPFNKD